MRQQFLPLALCLLFVFISKTSIATSLMEVNLNHSEHLYLKGVLENNEVDFSLMTDTEKIKDDSGLQSPNQSIAYNNPTRVENTDFAPFEEFSYISSPIVVGGISEFSNNHVKISESILSNNGLSFKNGMFYGFAIMLLLLNIVCYFLFDQKLYIYYSLALIGLLGTFSFNDGLYTAMGMSKAQDPQLIESVFLLVTAGFSSLFASKYLTLKEFYPKFYWGTLTLLAAATIITAMAFISQEMYYTTTIVNTISVSIMTSYFLIGVFLFGVKNYAKFYVIASFIPLLFFIDFFVMKNLGFEFLLTEYYHLKAAVLVEMILLSYAIIYRLNSIKEENLMRQTELRIFLKRQEVLNRKNAMKLMEEVYLENLIMHYDLDGLEIKLLQYISEGKENSVIARKLKSTESEIEELTVELYHKLQISEHVREDIEMVDSQPDYIYN